MVQDVYAFSILLNSSDQSIYFNRNRICIGGRERERKRISSLKTDDIMEKLKK